MSNVLQMFPSEVPRQTARHLAIGSNPNLMIADAVAHVLTSADLLTTKLQELSQQLAVVDQVIGFLPGNDLRDMLHKQAKANRNALALARHRLTLEVDKLPVLRDLLPGVETTS